MCSRVGQFAKHRAWAKQRVNDAPGFFGGRAQQQAPRLAAWHDDLERGRCLVDLKVIEQVTNPCRNTKLQFAWQQRQKLEVRGLVRGLGDGPPCCAGGSIDGTQSWDEHHEASVNSLG